jgi:hypothetical protein
MAVNEEYEDQRRGRGIGRVSSQAGLNAFTGGRAKTLPSAPAPGQPGSRFNPVVVDRGERVNHEEAAKGPKTKSLPLNMPPGMIQGIPAAVRNQTRDEESEQTVAGAAAQGFAGGFMAGAQNRMFGASDGGQQGDANPSWRENNREVVALNTKIMAASAGIIAMLDRDIASTTAPSDAAYRAELIATRTEALEHFRAMQISMAEDEVNVDVQAGAYTDADMNAQRQLLQTLSEGNELMRADPQDGQGLDRGLPTGEQAGPGRTAPVRNADGKSLADLTAPAPGEDPLPGTSQPLAVDVLDAVQGVPPRSAAKGIAKGVSRAVVMNPAHVAGLASLEDGHADGLESSGSYFGR